MLELRLSSKLVAMGALAMCMAPVCSTGFTKAAQAQELAPGKIEIKGSRDYRETVDSFLKGLAPKVIGGKIAPDGAYPWQVSLVVSWIPNPAQGHFCGGSIYSSRWIITAAHCVTDNQPQDINVVIGTNKLVSSATRVNIKRIVMHKGYKAVTSDNDIALLEMMSEIKLDDRSKAIPMLAVADEDKLLAPGQLVTVTGWGAVQEGGPVVKDLRHVEVPSVSRATCNQAPSYDGKITENMICAGVALGGKDSCQGDSGGPLVSKAPAGGAVLAGIVSWGDGCAQPAKFGVYTRVARYVDWVKQCVSNPVC